MLSAYQWQARASEVLTLAGRASDRERLILIEIATAYDRLANLAAQARRVPSKEVLLAGKVPNKMDAPDEQGRGTTGS